MNHISLPAKSPKNPTPTNPNKNAAKQTTNSSYQHQQLKTSTKRL
jgi:hypothetical protein